MAGELSLLASKKLLVVTGKGGAGKSLLSLALAHRLAALGKNVWLVELGRKRDKEFTRLPELVGRSKLGHKPTEVNLPGSRQKIKVSVLDPAESLGEYVDMKLPTGGLASVLLNNKVTASFLEVVPGLPDLVHLGKLWYALTQDKNGPDLVVLDAPASGHAVSLLNAPMNFKRITKVGPVYKDASLMAEFLADPAQTAILLAALPEEMSVRETMDLQKLLARDFPSPFVFVNKIFPELPAISLPEGSQKENPLWKAYSYSFARALREKEAASSLEGAVLLPFLFPESSAPPLYLRMSECLA